MQDAAKDIHTYLIVSKCTCLESGSAIVEVILPRPNKLVVESQIVYFTANNGIIRNRSLGFSDKFIT